MSIQLSSAGNQLPVNSAAGETQAATSASASASSSSESSESSSNSDIRFSSRAQKIQKLNEEFFPNGPASVRITPDFIQRLEEYGFISGDEAKQLGNKVSENPELSGPLGALTTSMDSLAQRLEEQDPDHKLVTILKQADAILENLDGSKPSSLATDIKTVSAELTDYLKTDDAEQLSEEEKEAMEQLQLALKIADRMNPENLSSSKLNSYLAFAN